MHRLLKLFKESLKAFSLIDCIVYPLIVFSLYYLIGSNALVVLCILVITLLIQIRAFLRGRTVELERMLLELNKLKTRVKKLENECKIEEVKPHIGTD